MHNYLYKIEFFSGYFESYFYNQIIAKSEKDAIIQLVSEFTGKDEDNTINFIGKNLGKRWTVQQFWNDMNKRFSSADECEGYTLIWIKKIDFDLDTI